MVADCVRRVGADAQRQHRNDDRCAQGPAANDTKREEKILSESLYGSSIAGGSRRAGRGGPRRRPDAPLCASNNFTGRQIAMLPASRVDVHKAFCR